VTQWHIPENLNLQQHHCENLKSHNKIDLGGAEHFDQYFLLNFVIIGALLFWKSHKGGTVYKDKFSDSVFALNFHFFAWLNHCSPFSNNLINTF
jgi:hypothetical protein